MVRDAEHLRCREDASGRRLEDGVEGTMEREPRIFEKEGNGA
jgi:hypothetical protein